MKTVVAPTKNPKNQVEIDIKRLGDIKISGTGGKLHVVFPLQITATILNSRVNLLTKGIKPVTTEAVLTLGTPGDLYAQWHLVTRFSLVNVEWKKPAVVKFPGIPFDLTEKIDGALKENNKKLTVFLDKEINKSVSLAKPVGKIWTDLQKPMIILKQPPYAYLKLMPQTISGNLDVQKEHVYCYTSIKVKVAMVTETDMKVQDKSLPAFNKKNNTVKESNIYVYVFAEFDRVNRLISEKFDGFEVKNDKISLIVSEPHLYANDSGLTVELKTKGTVVSRLFATVQPYFDSITQQFKLNNFVFNVVSENVLLNAGYNVLYEKVRDSLQTFMTFGMDTLIQKVPSLIESAIAKGKTGKTIDVEMDAFKIYDVDIEMDAKRIHFLVHTSFSSGMEIK